MFRKLLKYELRSVMKDFSFLWIGILVVSVVNAFTISLGNNADMDGMTGFFVVALPLLVLFALYVAAFVVALLYVIQRFYRGLLGREGYLMFTLPVTPAQLLGAKALTALIIEVVSVVVAILGGVIILLVQVPPDTWGFTIGDAWEQITAAITRQPAYLLAMVELVVFMLLSACQTNLHLYAGMSLGHLAKKNRVAWSVVGVVGLNMLVSVVSSLLGGVMGELSINEHVLKVSFSGTVEPLQTGIDSAAVVMATGLTFACLWSAVICAAWFFLSRYVLKNKLNLE